MAGHPLRPARDRRLGGPLPRQLANPTQAHPPARGPKVPRFPPKGLCGISPAFAGLSPTRGQIPTRYSPVRHSSAPEGPLPFDLHVLGMPPAFNLSHDQTLQFYSSARPRFRKGACIFASSSARRRPKAAPAHRPRPAAGASARIKLSDQAVKELRHPKCRQDRPFYSIPAPCQAPPSRSRLPPAAPPAAARPTRPGATARAVHYDGNVTGCQAKPEKNAGAGAVERDAAGHD